MKLPSLGAWDNPTSKSPGLYAPPDMNSKSGHDRNIRTKTRFSPGIVSGQYPLEEGPLSQMSEAVANLDKSGGEGPHTPCTPHTPGLPATPNTPGTGHKSPRSGMTSERNNKDFTNDIKTDFNLEDLNFDPAAIIGDNNGDWNVSYLSTSAQCTNSVISFS